MSSGEPYTFKNLISTLSFGLLDDKIAAIIYQTGGPAATGFSIFVSAVLDVKITKARFNFNMATEMNAFSVSAEIEVSIFGVAKIGGFLEASKKQDEEWQFVVMLQMNISLNFEGPFLQFLEQLKITGADGSLYLCY